jgi:hypothetical protein
VLKIWTLLGLNTGVIQYAWRKMNTSLSGLVCSRGRKTSFVVVLS